MYRPLAVVGFTCVLTLIALRLFENASIIVFLCIAMLGILLALFLKEKTARKALITCCVSVLVSVLVFSATWYGSYVPATTWDGAEAKIVATVKKEPEYQFQKYYYYVQTSTVNGKEEKLNIRLSSSKDLGLFVDDKIDTTLNLYSLGTTSDVSLNKSLADGYFLGGYTFAEPVVSTPEKHSLSFYLATMRIYISENIKSNLPGDEGALLRGMFIGDTSSLSPEIVSDFRITGLSHIFSVSGLHMSIWAGVVTAIRFKERRKQNIANIFAMFFIVFFMALTGFTSSVMRSGIMMIMILLGNIFWREADGINSMGFSAIIICLLNPFAVLDAGFILSFSATLGILTFGLWAQRDIVKKIDEKLGDRFQPLRNPLNALSSIIIISLAALLTSAPASILIFGSFSLVSPLANLIVTNLSGVAMVLGGIASIFPSTAFFGVLSKPLFFATGVLNKFMITTSSVLADIPSASMRIDKVFASLVFASLFILVGALLLLSKKKVKWKPVIPIFLAFTLCSALIFQVFNKSIVKITICDVGNGTAVIMSDGRQGVVLGVGGNFMTVNKIEYALERASVKETSTLIVPRNALTESEYLDTFLDENVVDTIFLPKNFTETLATEIPNTYTLSNDKLLKLARNITIESYTSEHDSFVFITVNSFHMLLCMSPESSLENLPDKWLSADVLLSRQALPKRNENYPFTMRILSMDDVKYKFSYKQLVGDNVTAVTGGFGDIDLSISKNGEYTIRRIS